MCLFMFTSPKKERKLPQSYNIELQNIYIKVLSECLPEEKISRKAEAVEFFFCKVNNNITQQNNQIEKGNKSCLNYT